MNPNIPELRAMRPHFPFNRTHGRIEVYEHLGEDTFRTAWLLLAACPFCGGQDLSVCDRLEVDEPRNPIEVVVCPECGCTGPWAKTEVQAVRSWNTWNNTEARQLTEWEYGTFTPSETDLPF